MCDGEWDMRLHERERERERDFLKSAHFLVLNSILLSKTVEEEVVKWRINLIQVSLKNQFKRKIDFKGISLFSKTAIKLSIELEKEKWHHIKRQVPISKYIFLYVDI